MAKLVEILSKERERENRDHQCEIRLFQEGTFLRAYEWSAWLCFRYVNPFKVTRKRIKDSDDTFVFVGFPISSLGKYTIEGASVEQLDEKEFVMHLPDTVLPRNATQVELTTDFSNWKHAVPMTEGKTSKSDLEDAIDSGKGNNLPFHPRLTDIMQQILTYPIEQKSPIDCMLFLGEIKKQIAHLL